MQPGNDGMSNGQPPVPPQGYQNVQQMMAPRYAPQPVGGAPSFPGPFPQAPNLPSPPGGPPTTQQQQQHMMQLQMQRHQQLQYQQQMQQMQQMQQHNPQQYQQQQQQQQQQRHPNQSPNLQQPKPPQLQQNPATSNNNNNNNIATGGNRMSNNNSINMSGNNSNTTAPSPRSRPAPFAPPLYQPPAPSASSSSSSTTPATNIKKGQLASKTRPQPPAHHAVPSSSSTTSSTPNHPNPSAAATSSSSATAPVPSGHPPSSPSTTTTSTKKDSHKAYLSSIAHNKPSEATILAHIQQTETLTKCDWKDKTLWATRQILGGNSINGFLRATATAQRIKKQRARQTALTKKTTAAAAAATAGGGNSGTTGMDESSSSKHDAAGAAASKHNKNAPFDAVAEEQLKKDIMNPRTAKKIKSELETGLQFCATLHNLVRGILFEVDPTQAPYLPACIKLDHELVPTPAMMMMSGGGSHLPSTTSSSAGAASTAAAATAEKSLGGTPKAPGTGGGMPPPTTSGIHVPGTVSSIPASSNMTRPPQNSFPMSSSSAGVLPPSPAGTAGGMMTGQPQPFRPQMQQRPLTQQQRPSLPGSSSSSSSSAAAAAVVAQQQHPNQSNKTTASPGNASGSTLRRSRKKKLPPSKIPPLQLSEFDDSGKRVYSKKEHNFRVFDVLRFRPLQQGDFVAARVSSRDLWILARVLKDYPGINMGPSEFLLLTEARRDGLFREKVIVKDVEDKDQSGSTAVARNLILPLPRTYSEASEWGVRCKKGSRVYAMYPQTTSLYSATVVDSTTYCREDDDIIVVDFDGEEADPVTGQTPTYHIPARFVTLIPRTFPAAQTNTASKTSGGKRKSATASVPSAGGGGPGSSPGGNKRGRQMSLSNIMPTNSDDALNDMLSEMEDFPTTGGPLDNFDQLDLDFDQPTTTRR